MQIDIVKYHRRERSEALRFSKSGVEQRAAVEFAIVIRLLRDDDHEPRCRGSAEEAARVRKERRELRRAVLLRLWPIRHDKRD